MKKLIFASSLALFLISASIASAQDQSTTQKQTFEQKCASIQSKITTKITNYDIKKEAHIKAYNNLKTRLQKAIDRLGSKGYDTSKVKADLVVLGQKIDKFSQDYATYIAKLKELQTLACGHSEAQFKENLVAVRNLLKVVHQDGLDIRSYYRNTIREDIKALRK